MDALVAEARKAARDLAGATARVSKKLVEKADVVAKDPSGSARTVARTASRELDKARKEIEKALSRLK